MIRIRFLIAIIGVATALTAADAAGPQRKGLRSDRSSRAEQPIRGPRGFQDPAFSRGLEDGRRRGLEDGRRRQRYDPVRHGEYRKGDAGYRAGYGGKDGYKTNYREGFRQGYEAGYREGARDQR